MNTKRNLEKEATIDDFVATFENAAKMHGLYTQKADHRKVNQQYNRLAMAYREIRKSGVDAQQHFLRLVDNDSLSVRVWAAMYALEFAPHVAEPILANIARGSVGHPRTDAEMVLQEWRAGRLRFD